MNVTQFYCTCAVDGGAGNIFGLEKTGG
jgi:hypothetical protein